MLTVCPVDDIIIQENIRGSTILPELKGISDVRLLQTLFVRARNDDSQGHRPDRYRGSEA